jgi:mannose-6-phosphate isomerase-like protein (cupin superfamily)
MTIIREGIIPDELASLGPDELHAVYMQKQERFAQAARELDRRRLQNRLLATAEENPVADAGPHQRMIIGPEIGFNIHNFHVFTSGRAAGGDRYHTHGDAVKFYVRGRGYETIGDQRFAVKVGDFVHVPANVWHGTENPYDEPLVFLAAQQFPGTYRQVPTPFVHLQAPHQAPEVRDLSTEEMGKLEPWPLYLRYLEEQMSFGRVTLELQQRREHRRLYVPAEELPLLGWGPGKHMVISPERGFDIYAFHIFLEHIPAGAVERQEVTAAETVCYCMTGQAEEAIGGRKVEVKAGDFLFVPAFVSREMHVRSGEVLRYLCWQQIPGTYVQHLSPSGAARVP